MKCMKLGLLILGIVAAPFILISYYHLINDFIYKIFDVKEGYGSLVGYFSFLLTLAVPIVIIALFVHKSKFS